MSEFSKSIPTYLGQKGYTISKKDLSLVQINEIKADLTVKPYVHGAPTNGAQQPSFAAYRESPQKIYVPHYYGVDQFGPPKEYKLSQGLDIHLEFKGSLRDYQQPVVKTYLDHVQKLHAGGGLLELPCAWGKTSASLFILSQLKKKTIVIVHKEFLMNQWIERIAQFLPGARVGKIQGKIIDIEDKDIVLCMLQSLVLKNYSFEIFNSFGLTIIDEVHHISSQTFSNALFKVVTKYMLGLSATMNRKDGTTRIFKMFLGNIIHKVERKDEHNVEVRGIIYKTNDDEFNETILDYKGQPQISSMISKLCCYNPRTEFIIKVLNDFIKNDDVDSTIIEENKKKMDMENPYCKMCNKNNHYLVKNTCCENINYCLVCMDNLVQHYKNNPTQVTDLHGNVKYSTKRPRCPDCNKILKYEQNYIENPYVKPIEKLHTIVMSHNLNILQYMYNKFVCKNYASVGYYVGGMSEEELKKTEKKQVIFASYSMCSEGLDIPTLNAEFLITPKTDVIQIVGRILRAKHAFANPIIYDFIDTHEVFRKQWLKRKAYYKKQNYRIIYTSSESYSVDQKIWTDVFQPNLNTKIKKVVNKTSNKNKSSSDNSIVDDSDTETDFPEEKQIVDFISKNDFLPGKCLISIKK
jgi:superfamily II DNA or RNA helicase